MIGASSIRSAKLDLAAVYATDIEQIIHQTDHLADLTLQHFGGRMNRFPVALGQSQRLGRMADRRKRIPQLMSEHRQELVLPPVRLRQIVRYPA